MIKIIIPNTYIKEITSPLIFLAGPIRGAPNWQNEAIDILSSQNTNLIIASPRKEIENEFTKHVLSGDETYFSRQRAWERHYLDIASRKGAILFWLPEEVEHNCAKAYGATTRLELGQLMTMYKHDKSIRFCIGSDGRFSELSTIEYDLSLDAPDKDIKKTLKETCLEALRLINQ